MNAARSFAVAATIAAVSVWAPSTASAAPMLSGHYTMTATSESGATTTSDWYFTSCGQGCASVAATPGGPVFGQALLRNGQWTLFWSSDAVCPDGTSVPGALSSYDTWDPNTLAGTDESALNRQVCGYQLRPPRVTQEIQLTQAR
jgi:hypothetical protein